MTGWILSILALHQMGGISKTVMTIQLSLLAIAQVANTITLFGANQQTSWFRLLNLSWPASNAFMLVIALTTVGKDTSKVFPGLYSTFAWSLPGILIYTAGFCMNREKVQRHL